MRLRCAQRRTCARTLVRRQHIPRAPHFAAAYSSLNFRLLRVVPRARDLRFDGKIDKKGREGLVERPAHARDHLLERLVGEL